VSVSIYFVSEDGITQPSAVTVGEILTEKMYLSCLAVNWKMITVMLCCQLRKKGGYARLTKFVFKGKLC
jgi:hypothetical protein